MFGWAYDFGSKFMAIRACDECQASLRQERVHHFRLSDEDKNLMDVVNEYHWRTGTCQKCTCWFQHKNSPLLHIPVPFRLKRCFDSSVEYLSPKELNFEYLRSVVRVAHRKVYDQEWTIADADAFLKAYCVPAEYTNRIFQNAHRVAVELLVQTQPDFAAQYLQQDIHHLQEEIKANPVSYQPIQPPALWDDIVPLSSYVESPMHLLFLGVVESVVKLVHEWLLRRRKGTAFCAFARTVTNDIVKLGVPWCKLLSYSPTGNSGAGYRRTIWDSADCSSGSIQYWMS